MIDLTRFTDEDIKTIEEVINGELDSLYRIKETYKKNNVTYFSSKYEEKIEKLTILKTKIINLKLDRRNK